MVEVGQAVRHRTQRDWGVGQVVAGRSDGKVEIRFSGRGGSVLFAAGTAGQMLEVVWVSRPLRLQLGHAVEPECAAPLATGRCVHRSLPERGR